MSTTTDRSVAVMRMHLVDRVTLLVIPTSLLVTILAINVVIWLFVAEDGRQTGGAASIGIFVLVSAMFAIVRGLPFALGMGSSRRAFTIGTGLTGGVLALGYGTLLLVLQVVERATDGWGLHGHFLWFGWFGQDPWPVSWLLFVVVVFACFTLGELLASVWARWSTTGLAIAGPLALLAIGGLAILVTAREDWHAVGRWFAGQTPLTATGWCAVLAVVCTATTWGILRRVRA